MSDNTTSDPDETLRNLNKRFYSSADPADYIFTRLLTLLAIAGQGDAVFDLLKGGVQYSGLSIQFGPASTLDNASLDRYVTIESQVLLHHAAEAVLRLYVAHDQKATCPWIEVAKETNFSQFKETVRKTIREKPLEDLKESVASIFLGRRTAPKDATAEWTDAVKNISTFLRLLSQHWLDDSPLYNSVKHGLAVISGEAILQFLDKEDSPTRGGDGPSVEYLQKTSWQASEDGAYRDWTTTTRWIDVRESLALSLIASYMLNSLWTVAKFKYAGIHDESAELFFPSNLTPEQLRNPTNSMVRTMSIPLVREYKEPLV